MSYTRTRAKLENVGMIELSEEGKKKLGLVTHGADVGYGVETSRVCK